MHFVLYDVGFADGATAAGLFSLNISG